MFKKLFNKLKQKLKRKSLQKKCQQHNPLLNDFNDGFGRIKTNKLYLPACIHRPFTNFDLDLDENLCQICDENLANVNIHPCKHRLCPKCITFIDICPFCRGEIKFF